MKSIVYIHGFLSSPLSYKARLTESWLSENQPDTEFLCPAISAYPHEAKAQLEKALGGCSPGETCLIGSSLGGYWATHLIERGLANKAVLINPAVRPQARMKETIGETINSYYSDESYTLSHQDMADLEMFDVNELSNPSKYWLMVQTADETLDYRLAVEKYQDSEQLVEEGGNHSFEGYEKWLPQIIDFFSRD